MSSSTNNEESNIDGPKTPKKMPMTCHRRKLKCDGNKLYCGNCDQREYPCNYTPVSATSPK
ncbi:hypothetical protein BDN70DRAFT_883648 [Pholiota conissans]|uniref:Zn(2)-C6 fungal-type domain-containing protein n=1 Tax=Pholiota conissans TaxID=109636 RepID=A0A9P5YX16_9AGAR|nr:hypothetical protein BDN70DRAFT_883648 [Pholiota conissans]